MVDDGLECAEVSLARQLTRFDGGADGGFASDYLGQCLARRRHREIGIGQVAVGAIVDCAIRQSKRPPLVEIGEHEVDVHGHAAHLVRLQSHCDEREQLVDGQRPHQSAVRCRPLRWSAVAQFLCTHQVRIAERCRFALVTHLLQCRSLQRAGSSVGGVGEDEVVDQFGDPAIVARLVRSLRRCEQRIRTTGERDVALAGFSRRVRMKVARVAVVPAEVSLIHRFHVVNQAAVVANRVALLVVLRGRAQQLCDLGGHVPMVGEAKRLVVHPPVQIALPTEKLAHVFGAPARPMVRGEHDLGAITEQLDGVVDVGAPRQRVARLCSADRNQVVHVVRAILRHAQPTVIGEEEVHLRRCFGLRRQLEDDANAVDDQLLASERDVLRWRDEARRAERHTLAETTVHVALRTGRQQRAELVQSTSVHCVTGQEVLRNGLAHEVLGGDDAAATGVDIGLGGDTQHAAEVVEVAMRVDDGGDRPLTEMCIGQLEAGVGGGSRRERVDDHPARLASHEGDVGDVVAAGLPHTVGYFEETVDVVQLGLAPQAGVHGVGVR